MSHSILITKILEFISTSENEDGGILFGFSLILLYMLIDFVQYFSWMHASWRQELISLKTKNGVISMIYDKLLRISSSTNKEYSTGEIITLIQVDSDQVRAFGVCFSCTNNLKIGQLYNSLQTAFPTYFSLLDPIFTIWSFPLFCNFYMWNSWVLKLPQHHG